MVQSRNNAKIALIRRAKKEDVPREAFIAPDGLSVCLDCWKRWMLTDDRNLSSSRMQLRGGDDLPERDADGNLIKTGYDSNPWEEQYLADNAIGAATGAMIDSLKPMHRWAIYRKCSIVTVWKFPNTDFMAVIIDAEIDLNRMLRKNIATSGLF